MISCVYLFIPFLSPVFTSSLLLPPPPFPSLLFLLCFLCFILITGSTGHGDMPHRHLGSENSRVLIQKPRRSWCVLATVRQVNRAEYSSDLQ